MWLPHMKAVLAQTVTPAQRMRLGTVVLGPQLLTGIHMHVELKAEQASM